MSRKEVIAVVIIALVVIAGPMYVLLVKDTRSSKPAEKPQTSQTTAEPEPEPEPEVLAFDKTKYSNDDPTSVWVVVNKQRPLSPVSYAPTDLIVVGGGQRLRSEAAQNLAAMLAAAKTEDHIISPLSGYRSYSTQVSVYANEVKTYGQAVADTQSARPGTSEHQTGWSIDVGGGGCGIEDCFGNTPEGKWIAANAYKYGFIIRYVPGREAVTGYRPEPWHIRYIGVDLATEMNKQGVLTLEEFFNLPPAPTY